MEAILTCVGYNNSTRKGFYLKHNHYTLQACSILGSNVNNMRIIFTTHNTNRVIDPIATKYPSMYASVESDLKSNTTPETKPDLLGSCLGVNSKSRYRLSAKIESSGGGDPHTGLLF